MLGECGVLVAFGLVAWAPAAAGWQGPAAFKVGAATVSFTPPRAGALAHDPADCDSTGTFNGPRHFAFEEPYKDQQSSGLYGFGDDSICGALACILIAWAPGAAAWQGPASFKVGAATVSFTPPPAGALAHDPADCDSTGTFNGPPPLRVRGALQGPAVLGPLRLRRPVRRLQRQRALGREPARRRRRLAALLQPRRRQRRRPSDGRLERRADDRGGGARQRGGVQRLPPADPPAGRGRRCPPRRDLHQLQPRRVGPGHDRDLRRQPADVERQRILRRLHGSEGGDGHRAGREPRRARRRSATPRPRSPRTCVSAGRRTPSSTTS